MDRAIVYDGALPQTTDILNTNKFALLDSAYQNRAFAGTNSLSGFAFSPTSPASLFVNIGPGSVYQLDATDATSYGDLGIDNNIIVKQGINNTTVSLQLTPPGTVGFSINYLVQIDLNDVDTGAQVLSYYNSANPAQPFSGPGNSLASNFTIRSNPAVVALKAGVAATTGTQTTPQPDPGFTALYSITVPNGATAISTATLLPQAPVFPTLLQVPISVQSGTWEYCLDTGVANAYVITPVPNCTALVAGMGFRVKILTANSGASTLTINFINASGVAATLGPVTIKRGSTAGVVTGDLVSGQVVELIYDGTFFQMANYLGSGTNTNTNTQVGIPYIADSGAVNALVATFSPTVLPLTAGTTIAVKLANTITGACTINCNGGGLKNVTLGDLTNPPFNVFVAGMVLVMEYDGTQFQIINTSAGMFFRKPTANYTIFVNTSTGSDTLCDGTAASVGSGTSGPFKTIGKAITTAWGYAPSQFTITIQIAAGTYNESIITPSYAGPNVIVNGAGVGSVTINSGNANCFLVTGPNTLMVENLTVQNNGVYPNAGFMATQGATMTTLNTASNACSIVFFATSGGTVNPGTHTFSGSGYSCFYGSTGGNINLGTFTYTFSTSISLSGAGSSTATAIDGNVSVNNVSPPTFVNPSFVNGLKFVAQLNGVVNTNTLGINFFPGNLAGTTASGGQISF